MKVTTPEILAVDAKRLSVMIGVSVRTIRRLNASGQLPPPVRIGKSVRWLLKDIEHWLERNRATAGRSTGGIR